MKTPAQRQDIKAAIAALLNAVLGDRADRHLVEPTLAVMLTTDVNDFVKYHPAEFAAQRVKDHEVLLRHPWFRPQRSPTSQQFTLTTVDK